MSPAARPWKRERAGRYRSSDGRFAIEGDASRWFVIDDEQRDELGLPRTVGPFATLDDAREAADGLRSQPAPESMLAARVEAGSAPAPGAKPRAKRPAPEPPKAGATEPAKATGRPPAVMPARPPAPPSRAAPRASRAAPGPSPAPSPPAWIDKLDAATATRARRLIAQLERAGFAEAERVVRAEIESHLPAIPRALLGRRVRRAALEPWLPENVAASLAGADARVRRAAAAAGDGLGEDELAAIVSFVARAVTGAVLDQVTGLERDPDAPAELPGWRLIEHDPADPTRDARIRLDEDSL